MHHHQKDSRYPSISTYAFANLVITVKEYAVVIYYLGTEWTSAAKVTRHTEKNDLS